MEPLPFPRSRRLTGGRGGAECPSGIPRKLEVEKLLESLPEAKSRGILWDTRDLVSFASLMQGLL